MVRRSIAGSLLAERQRQEGISTRELGNRIGVAHTTVIRFMNDQDVDLDTLEKVGEYLQVGIIDLLGMRSRVETEALSAQIAVLCQTAPSLARVFQEAINRVSSNNIHPEVVREIIRYAAYRLNMEKCREADMNRKNVYEVSLTREMEAESIAQAVMDFIAQAGEGWNFDVVDLGTGNKSVFNVPADLDVRVTCLGPSAEIETSREVEDVE